MKHFKATMPCLIFYIIFSGCAAQTKQTNSNENGQMRIGGAFENNEFTYAGIPAIINSIDTSAGWNQIGQKILLKGTVYKHDGKTPAPDVLIYYYHTNIDGIYLHNAKEHRSMPPNNIGQTHGYIRGWVKSDEEGKYFIYTVKPGSYPSHSEPAHVHITIKEPNDLNEYYIDDFLFDDDKFLIAAKRARLENRGGSGIVKLVIDRELQIGERNIVLGLNVPGYPK